MFKSGSIIVTALALSACASLPTYHPASKIGASGFSEKKISTNQYRVMFQGDSSTSRYEVEDYLLFRAAELTVEKGYDYFVISEQNSETKTRVVTTQKPAFYGRFDHLHGHRNYSFPYYAYGYDWGYPSDTQTREYTKYSAIAYIGMHRGIKPEGNDKAFNALEVMENLGPVDCWRTETHDPGTCKLSH